MDFSLTEFIIFLIFATVYKPNFMLKSQNSLKKYKNIMDSWQPRVNFCFKAHLMTYLK